MMNARELRIGNALQLLCDVVIVKDIRLDQQSGFKDAYYINGYAWGNLQPIPLTEDWLVRLGFKTDSYKQEFELNTINLDCEYTDKGEWVVFLKGNNIKPTESQNEYVCRYYPKADIQFVHQLQNLYWCLVGEELEIKL